MKREFTVGEVAKILNVARSTVVYWIKDKRITAYQTPGGNNRVTRDNLVKFMNSFNIPLDYIEGYVKKRVLMIECEPELIKLTSGLLEKEDDYEVKSASNWFEAGILTREYRPHVIIIDIAQKGLDPGGITQGLKQSRELSNVKTIAVSDLSTYNSKKLRKMGFSAFFEKPVDLRELRDRIIELI